MRSLLLIVVCLFSIPAGATGSYHDNDDGDVINNTTNQTYNYQYVKKGDKRANYIIGTAIVIWAGCSVIKLYQEGNVCIPFICAKKEALKDDHPLQITQDNVSDKPTNNYTSKGQ